MRHKRLGRIAACTAIALTAGMALAGPASADAPVAPKAPSENVQPAAPQPTGVIPGGTRTGLATAGVKDVAPPLFDVNHDGTHDLLYRSGTKHYLKDFQDDDAEFSLQIGEDSAYKDVIPAGDMDGNANPELLTLSVTGELSLHEVSSTDGVWSSNWRGRGWTIYNKVVGAGDLTGDGRPDLLARKHNGELYLYAATGNLYAPYRAAVKIGAGWGAYDQLVGGSDVTGDGIGDLLARTPSGNLYRYTGTGNASAPFRAAAKIGYGYQVYNQMLAVGDANGDGFADYLARDLSGTNWFYPGKSGGTVAGRLKSGTNWQHTDLFAGQGGIADHGKAGIAARSTGNTLFRYVSKADGKFYSRYKWSDDGGWPDFAPITFASSLTDNPFGSFMYVYQGRLYHGESDLGAGWGGFNALVGVGDLTGDGKGDLLARTSGGTLYLYHGNGAGTALGSKTGIGAGWGAYNKLLGAGDFTGDGRADLIARTSGGTLYLYPGTGVAKAPFKTRVKIGTGFGIYNKMAAAGDMTGDGRADLVGTDSAGNLWRYSATGLGGSATLSKRVSLGNGWGIYKNLY
ncbi:VCBS repeat-containing protein [Streptomyces bambusae]|uniref:FG-GAP repeat domain-containing protein n=1 Tax=Streptomyces bambusae TaxID=1550616 RepID=UPI001CFE786D|nr:VCBS repeat-containing protein [Streptomyces bambusae]MCB5167926.1 VCBS repeat-containing protein [Streptomyces bambusae]